MHRNTQAIIRDRIEVLRVVIGLSFSSTERTNASAIISGSRVMKKVILDGSKSDLKKAVLGHTIKTLLPVCREAKVELWKENFEVGNGKVDFSSQ